MALRGSSLFKICLAAALAPALSTWPAEGHAAGANTTPDSNRSTLGTPDQLRAERQVLALTGDPRIAAAQAQLRSELENGQPAPTAAARGLLDAAIGKWTRALMMREEAADLSHPQILWEFDDTPHAWFGIDYPGASGFGDDPNHIYRAAFVEGSGQYEITGHLPRTRPAMFSFEAVLGNPGMNLEHRLKAGAVDIGNQVALLTDRDIQILPDGTFHLTVGGAGASANRLATAPGLTELIIRDVLSDWNQQPVALQIRRLDAGADTKPLEPEEIVARTARDLSGYVHFWMNAQKALLRDTAANTLVGPSARAGGWGFFAIARCSLPAGQGLLITLDRAGAGYLGVQFADPWMVGPDGRRHQASLNVAQAAANADGSITVVVSPSDPGVTNWIDTAGLDEGFVMIRWEAAPPGLKADSLVRDIKLASLAQVARGDLAASPRISPAGRREQLERRAKDYAKRLGDGR
jgi:hypothetical protein